ncbi:MAG: type II toxin-antitoxin system VapC family toxin [Planctomycetales bacterium]|nr:type II toxin-antitoxin system VapC family toxin [Planctomycetales bacterium]
MRFWDSSGIVPLAVLEHSTERVLALLEEDRALTVWGMTEVEVLGAIWRRRRSAEITEAERLSAEDFLDRLAATATRVTDTPAVVVRARRLVSVHSLRAGDAAQLAAALVACDDDPGGLPLVTLDDRLAEAARKEGFRVLP